MTTTKKIIGAWVLLVICLGLLISLGFYTWELDKAYREEVDGRMEAGAEKF